MDGLSLLAGIGSLEETSGAGSAQPANSRPTATSVATLQHIEGIFLISHWMSNVRASEARPCIVQCSARRHAKCDVEMSDCEYGPRTKYQTRTSCCPDHARRPIDVRATLASE